MRSLLLLPLLAAPALASANDAFIKAETFPAPRVSGEIPSSADDKAWAAAPAGSARAYPQLSVRLNDRDANAAMAAMKPVPVTVKALHNGRDLGVLLEWPDESEDRVNPAETNAFGDGMAVEFPVAFGAGKRLPYIGMGDDAFPVYIHFQRAGHDGKSVIRESVAAGFDSQARAEIAGTRGTMAYDKARKAWRGVITRSLDAPNQSLKAGLVPVAIALWDGNRSQRGGNKALVQWKFLRLDGFPQDAAYVKEMSFGYNAGDLGDPAAGKAVASRVCFACHHLPGMKVAAPGIAPSLEGVGGIATYAYLKQSVLEPSAVIVPSGNPNRHYQKGATPDPNGALPNNDMYAWHTVTDGKRVSKMAPIPMSNDDLAALVAYLKTLGAEP